MLEQVIDAITDVPGIANGFARAARVGQAPRDEEVLAFCAKLTGLRGRDYLEIADEVRGTPLPAGLLGVRIRDAETGREIGGILSEREEPLDAWEVSTIVTLDPEFEESRWTETSALPGRDPGVLELQVRLEKREVATAAS
ncbi:hypothetical protein [Sphingomonas corticis]|uniref:Uncharacterized protein n=1 Tax=Sphingomonas corticis TaxID=2722791 RepID=A0ABX1CRC3_9SPHN|nr:hypothetical protein [Sphingomonas corticis]NJR80502.1 hypothetical protein [Sphingomonas corticis]